MDIYIYVGSSLFLGLYDGDGDQNDDDSGDDDGGGDGGTGSGEV